MISVVSVQCTSGGWPSQWEGRTSDGRPICVRYRSGYLSVRIGSKGESDGSMGEEVFGKVRGDDADGHLLYRDLQKETQGVVSWPSQEKKGR